MEGCYLCFDHHASEDIAQDKVLVARFEREAKAAAKIVTAHIVDIMGTGVDPATKHPYMVMEMLDGECAQTLLHRIGPYPPELAVRVGVQTCLGLERAHAAGVVHRDIKPANLFLAKTEKNEYLVKLLDFGVAKVKMEQATERGNDSLTRTGSVLGSPLFMSPEQARGLKSIDHRADIWSLGTVLYQLLCGTTPHQAIKGLGELIITICSEEPEPIRKRAPWVAEEIAEVVHGALKLAPQDRYGSAKEMLTALRGCLDGGWHIKPEMLVELSAEQRAADPEQTAEISEPPGAAPEGSQPEATVALDEAAFEAMAAAAGDAKPTAVANEKPSGAGDDDGAATMMLESAELQVVEPPEQETERLHAAVALKPASPHEKTSASVRPPPGQEPEPPSKSEQKPPDAVVQPAPGGPRWRLLVAIVLGLAVGGAGVYYFNYVRGKKGAPPAPSAPAPPSSAAPLSP